MSDLSQVSLSELYDELNRRRESRCQACEENAVLKEKIRHMESTEKLHKAELKHISDLLAISGKAVSESVGHLLTPGQMNVLAAAKSAILYGVAVSEGDSYTGGSGKDFSLVPGFPCWHLTCPVAQAEWQRRVTEEGLPAYG